MFLGNQLCSFSFACNVDCCYVLWTPTSDWIEKDKNQHSEDHFLPRKGSTKGWGEFTNVLSLIFSLLYLAWLIPYSSLKHKLWKEIVVSSWSSDAGWVLIWASNLNLCLKYESRATQILRHYRQRHLLLLLPEIANWYFELSTLKDSYRPSVKKNCQGELKGNERAR